MIEREQNKDMLQILDKEFYLQDSITVSQQLLGSVIETEKDGALTRARITETEAYPSFDAASHAYMRAPTPRTSIQYEEGGRLYVYLIMGLHIMTSVTTNKEGIADVVFIRSVEPIEGIDEMKKRRCYSGDDIRRIASGPGMLSKALGITKQDNGLLLFEENSYIRIYKDMSYSPSIESGVRINLGTHGADEEQSKLAIQREWRFFDVNRAGYLSK